MPSFSIVASAFFTNVCNLVPSPDGGISERNLTIWSIRYMPQAGAKRSRNLRRMA
jgi:hypothetical protein